MLPAGPRIGEFVIPNTDIPIPSTNCMRVRITLRWICGISNYTALADVSLSRLELGLNQEDEVAPISDAVLHHWQDCAEGDKGNINNANLYRLIEESFDRLCGALVRSMARTLES